MPPTPESFEAAPGRLLRALLWVTLVLLAGGFVFLAVWRRLNFDEALALRAGWLLVHGVPAEPPFHMPMVYALGWLGTLVADPGVVFLVGRLVVVVSVLGLLAWALAPFTRPTTLGVAILLALSQATFVVHGLEFRYDWALLVGWLAAHRLVLKNRFQGYFGLGLIAAWLAAHHLKGLYLAVALTLMVAVAAGVSSVDRGRRFGRFCWGAAVGALVWVGVSYALRLGRELGSVYPVFLDLSRAADYRMPLWDALGDALWRDAGWWLGASSAVVATAIGILRSRRRWQQPEIWMLAFAVVPLGLLLVHPRPWAYMLALPAPFLALLMARQLVSLARAMDARAVAVVVAATLAIHFGATRSLPWIAYADSIAAPRAQQVETLRLLRSQSLAGDRIIDPSGMAYFLPPCTREWYLDSLFEILADKGVWMRELGEVELADCRWLLNTYRVSWLPDPTLERLQREYTLVPGGGGLALRAGDPLLTAVPPWRPLTHTGLESFW
ncbi:MAG: hypothetical protein JRI55_18100 [Deltaproteobacteria bacterium]|jgi:hypothetical protein|nr:hypothetical protein [Deltaproteobacteria bacterium]